MPKILTKRARENNKYMRRTMTDKEVKRLLSDMLYYQDIRAWMVCALILATGARQKEVVELCQEHILQDRILLPGTKEDLPRSVPVNPVFLSRFQGYVKSLKLPDSTSPIFPVTRFSISVWIRNAFSRASLYNVLPTAQMLRCTYVTNLLRNGVSHDIVKELAGIRAPRQLYQYRKMVEK